MHMVLLRALREGAGVKSCSGSLRQTHSGRQKVREEKCGSGTEALLLPFPFSSLSQQGNKITHIDSTLQRAVGFSALLST